MRAADRRFLDAAIGEAKRLGLRTWIHARMDAAIHQAVDAGCTTISHAGHSSAEPSRYIHDKGVSFEPTVGLVVRNYLDHREAYLGTSHFSDDAFADVARLREAPPRAGAPCAAPLPVRPFFRDPTRPPAPAAETWRR